MRPIPIHRLSSVVAVNVMATLLASLVPRAAPAQSQGEPLGRLYLSFAPDSEVRELEVDPLVRFEWFLIAELDFADIGDPDRNETDGIKGWETCMELPPEINLTARNVLRPGFNGGDESCDENWIMILDNCAFGEDTPVALVRYEGMLTSEALNVKLTLGPASPSSIDANAPGWFVCVPMGQPTDIRPFEPGWEVPAVINGRIATDASSWSAMKALFDR